MFPLAILLFCIAIIAISFNIPGFVMNASSIAGAALVVYFLMSIAFTIVALSRRWPMRRLTKVA